MEYYFIIPLIIIVCLYVCYPFFLKRNDPGLYIEEEDENIPDDEKSLKYLQYEKDRIYRAIKEIEFDFGLGKLSDDDYSELRKSYIYQAAEIVKKMDELESSVTGLPEIKIEEEISNARRIKKSDYDIEEEIKKVRGKIN